MISNLPKQCSLWESRDNPDSSMRVTTKHGEMVSLFGLSFPISGEGRIHRTVSLLVHPGTDGIPSARKFKSSVTEGYWDGTGYVHLTLIELTTLNIWTYLIKGVYLGEKSLKIQNETS